MDNTSEHDLSERPDATEAAEELCEWFASPPACPVCGGQLQDIRRKLCCTRCHSIIETCCD